MNDAANGMSGGVRSIFSTTRSDSGTGDPTNVLLRKRFAGRMRGGGCQTMRGKNISFARHFRGVSRDTYTLSYYGDGGVTPPRLGEDATGRERTTETRRAQRKPGARIESGLLGGKLWREAPIGRSAFPGNPSGRLHQFLLSLRAGRGMQRYPVLNHLIGSGLSEIRGQVTFD